MIKKIPPAATPISAGDLWFGFKASFSKRSKIKEFESALSDYFGSKYCFAISSGKAAFYVILRALRRFSSNKEVNLPAYTDAGLILVIQRVGLEPVLCDISLDTFNLDLNLLPHIVSEKTLCVVPVHMFGIACDVTQIKTSDCTDRVFVVEDGAQAQGTEVRIQNSESKMAGTVGDIGFYSFNRGKNFPTYSGGCIVTDSKELAEAVEEELGLLPEPGRPSKLLNPVKLLLLALAVNPFVYKSLYKLISPFKSTTNPKDFTASLYTEFQAGAGLSLLERLSYFNERRFHNGATLYEGLAGIKGIVLPKILPNTKPAYNRLPVVFEDIDLREKVYRKLLAEGIESSKMYPRPLHHVFDLGYSQDKDPFPNATFFAQRVLTLPVHPLLTDKDLNCIIEVIKNA